MTFYLFRCCGLSVDVPPSVAQGAATLQLPHQCGLGGGTIAVGLCDLLASPTTDQSATTEAELPSGAITPEGDNLP